MIMRLCGAKQSNVELVKWIKQVLPQDDDFRLNERINMPGRFPVKQSPVKCVGLQLITECRTNIT